MSFRLSEIDELSRRDHHHLVDGDRCWYFGEYTAYKDWSYSDTNKLIKNFKKDMALRDTNQWRHKMGAIRQVGRLLSSAINTNNIANTIFVPTPPSKIATDPNYDPRIVQALEKASEFSGVTLPICECITQRQNMEADHRSGATRLQPEERAATYDIHLDRIPPNITLAYIVDDVLTTGSHFKGAEIALKNHLPHLQVNGLFIARTVHANPFEGFENIDLSSILTGR